MWEAQLRIPILQHLLYAQHHTKGFLLHDRGFTCGPGGGYCDHLLADQETRAQRRRPLPASRSRRLWGLVLSPIPSGGEEPLGAEEPAGWAGALSRAWSCCVAPGGMASTPDTETGWPPPWTLAYCVPWSWDRVLHLGPESAHGCLPPLFPVR